MSNHHDWRKDLEKYGISETRIGGQLYEQFKKNLIAPTSTSRTTGSPLSSKTQLAKCRAIINLVIALRELPDNPIKSLWDIGEAHVETLCGHWREIGNTIGGIENKLSHLRTLGKWIGKPRLVSPTDRIVALSGMQRRSGVATEDKSWSGNGVDAGKAIERAFRLEPCVGIQLLLQKAFGLRAQESFLLKPQKGFHGIQDMLWLRVEDGTKAKRKRLSPVLEDSQKAVLELAAKFANSKSGSTIPDQYSLEQWRSHYYYVCKQAGITKRDLGVTSHGLRHEALQNLYMYASGEEAPIKIIKLANDTGEYARNLRTKTEVQHLAEVIVAEAAGHSKVQKSGAYIGGHAQVRVISESKMELITDASIQEALTTMRGNKVNAAKSLKISRAYLYKRIGLLEQKQKAFLDALPPCVEAPTNS